jgi:hypothetical protein
MGMSFPIVGMGSQDRVTVSTGGAGMNKKWVGKNVREEEDGDKW